MNDKISFYLLSYSGNTVKQFAVTRRNLGIIVTCAILFSVVAAGIFFDYFHLKISFNKKEIEKTITSQSNEILSQRKQIQRFASEINSLKSNLVKLNDFEKKIRIIANIENPSEKDNLFGVGGSVPEDLDPKVPLTEKASGLMREMHEQARELNLASVSQEKVFESLITDLKRKRNLLSSTPSIWPTKGWVSSGFGYRISPFTGMREFHKGLDISNREGTKVMATADGVVTFAGKNGSFGNMIKIDHGHGIITHYGHLEKMFKKRGDAVKRGDVIGLLGDTGRSTGPHLHYEVFSNGLPMNPRKYILN